LTEHFLGGHYNTLTNTEYCTTAKMKLFHIFVGAFLILFTGVKAFPAILTSAMQQGGFETAQETVEAIKKRTITFDPVYQYVSNQGAHAFVPPNISGGDQRGMSLPFPILLTCVGSVLQC
jgi:hypothetical protein